LHAGYQVHVPIKATCSRSDANRDNALERMQQAGAIITNVESVLFELLREAGSAEFKAISKLIA
ncbi:MAG: hydrolase, partial [Desulfuromonadaceae bacterium]